MPKKRPEFWSPNNLSASGTWGCLRSLKQLQENFEAAKDLRMGTLAYYEKNATPKRKRQLADGMADQLHDMLVFILGAGYDPGTGRSQAVAAMSDVFVGRSQTLYDLAVTVENHFTF